MCIPHELSMRVIHLSPHALHSRDIIDSPGGMYYLIAICDLGPSVNMVGVLLVMLLVLEQVGVIAQDPA